MTKRSTWIGPFRRWPTRAGAPWWNGSRLGPASVSELAEPLAMSLAAVVQHVQVLEACGVVTTEKVGRTRMCRIEPAAMTAAEGWIADRRRGWEARLDRLGDVLNEVATTEEKP